MSKRAREQTLEQCLRRHQPPSKRPRRRTWTQGTLEQCLRLPVPPPPTGLLDLPRELRHVIRRLLPDDPHPLYCPGSRIALQRVCKCLFKDDPGLILPEPLQKIPRLLGISLPDEGGWVQRFVSNVMKANFLASSFSGHLSAFRGAAIWGPLWEALFPRSTEEGPRFLLGFELDSALLLATSWCPKYTPLRHSIAIFNNQPVDTFLPGSEMDPQPPMGDRLLWLFVSFERNDYYSHSKFVVEESAWSLPRLLWKSDKLDLLDLLTMHNAAFD